MTILEKFGNVIRKQRKAKDWTQENLSFHVKLHRNYIGAVERGEKNISLKNMAKLAASLDLKISDIFLKIGE